MPAQPHDGDDLFKPSLGTARDIQPAPYNLFAAVVPGFIGGPIAVTMGMAVIAHRLRVSRLDLIGLVTLGVAGELVVLVAITRQGEVTRLFQAAAFGVYLLQYLIVSSRFRAWQLRGRETSSFFGAGLVFALIGLLIYLIAAAASGALD